MNGAEVVAALEELQDSRCAGCGGIEFVDFRYAMVIDHCHVTGMVRGLLCLKCNRDEGHRLGRLDEYRAMPPASVLGIEYQYTPSLSAARNARNPDREELAGGRSVTSMHELLRWECID